MQLRPSGSTIAGDRPSSNEVGPSGRNEPGAVSRGRERRPPSLPETVNASVPSGQCARPGSLVPTSVMRTLLFSWCWPAWLILPALLFAEPPGTTQAGARRQVEAVARELVAGLAAGDWAPWERHASDDLVYTTEFGRTLTKRQLEAVFAASLSEPRRTLTLTVIAFQERGDAAVLAIELVAQEREGTERYRVTQTFWRLDGRWRLVASQACEVA